MMMGHFDRDAACARRMGTAEGAGLGDERNDASRPRDCGSLYEPHAPITGQRTVSPHTRDAPTTRESAAGDWSRPHPPRARTAAAFEVTRHRTEPLD